MTHFLNAALSRADDEEMLARTHAETPGTPTSALNFAPRPPSTDAPVQDGYAASGRDLQRQKHIRQWILGYHRLTEGTPHFRYDLAARDFEDHLKLLSCFSTAAASNITPPVITFDDGHISNYSIALPLLAKDDCKAVFFVIVGRIGKEQDFMNWSQLREVVSLGHRVEAHSWSHPFLTGCSDLELRSELLRARETLEDALGIAVTALSAPHGRIDDRVVRACQEFGYKTLYTSDPWATPRFTDGISIIGRSVVHSGTDSECLRKWFSMSRSEIRYRRAGYKLKQTVKRTLGNELYHKMWCRLSGWTGPSSDVG